MEELTRRCCRAGWPTLARPFSVREEIDNPDQLLFGQIIVPLYWLIDSRARLVTLTAEGKVTPLEMEDYLTAVKGAGAIGYRKIFDGTASDIAMSREDLLTLGARFRSLHSEPTGALAIVLPQDKVERIEPILGVLAAADRPMRLFTTVAAARRWIKPPDPRPAMMRRIP